MMGIGEREKREWEEMIEKGEGCNREDKNGQERGRGYGGVKWLYAHTLLCTNVVYHQMSIFCNGELKETGGITNQCSELEGKYE